VTLAALIACTTPAPVGLPPVPAGPSTPRFTRRDLPGTGVDRHRFLGAGVAVADFDDDGHLDLLLPGPHDVRLLRGPGLEADPDAIPARDWAQTVGAAAADADGDGDLDVIVTRFGPPDVLLRNRGDGTFEDAAPPALDVSNYSQSAAWADIDGDGDLDLAIAGHGPVEGGEQVLIPGPADPTRLLLNDGKGGFTDATDRIPPRMQDAYTFVVTFSDLDGDGAPDLYQGNDFPIFEEGLAAVQRGDRFALAPELGLQLHAAGMGMGVADVDADGGDDFLIPVWNRVVYLRSRDGIWVNHAQAAGMAPAADRDEPYVGWGADWGDLDNDGQLDAVVVFGHLDPVSAVSPSGTTTDNALRQRDAVFARQGAGQYEETSALWGLEEDGAGRGVVVADLNGDGGLDVVRRDLNGPTVVHLSDYGPAQWLVVRPRPMVRAVGAKVAVHHDGAVQIRTIRAGGTGLACSGPPEAHFGLGATDTVDRVVITWPDGTLTERTQVSSGQVLTLR